MKHEPGGARELGAELALSVPTLFVVERGGRIARASEGFDRGALEAVAGRMGIAGLRRGIILTTRISSEAG